MSQRKPGPAHCTVDSDSSSSAITEFLQSAPDTSRHSFSVFHPKTGQYLIGKPEAALTSLAEAKAVVVSKSTNLSAEKAKSINEFLGDIIADLERHISKKEPLPH